MPTVSEVGADKCPYCKRQMIVHQQSSVRDPHGGDQLILIVYHCETKDCRWEGTGRFVTTDVRGNLVTRDSGSRGVDKDFPKMSDDRLSAGKRQVEEYLGKRIEDDSNLPGSKTSDELPPGAE